MRRARFASLAARSLFVLAFIVAGCRTSLPGGGLKGRVVVTGGSAAGLTVVATGPTSRSAVTDGDGGYAFDGLPLGAYTLSATVHDTSEGTQSVGVAANGPATAPELRFTAVGGLRGRATRGGDQSGDAGILVTVTGSSALGVTADDGSYHITLVPVGTYDVQAQVAGFRTGAAPGQIVRWGQDSDVPEIDLVIGAGDCTLRGVARLYGQSDHGGTTVSVTGTGLATTTGSDGSWEIDALPEGTYALDFANGTYHETVPAVEALTGSNGLVVDGAFYDLSQSPLLLYTGTRVVHTNVTSASWQFAAVSQISPDGAHLVFEDVVDGKFALRTAALAGTSAFTLADEWSGQLSDFFPPLFSADGTLVAFINGHLLETGGASANGAMAIVDGAASWLWSPTSHGLAFTGPDPVTGDASLGYATIDGLTQRHLVTDKNMQAPVFSHDGSRLYYRTQVDNNYYLGSFMMTPIDGSGPVALANGAAAPSIRGDARWALVLANVDYDGGTGDLVSVDLDSGVARTLASTTNYFLGVAFAGDRAVYETGDGIFSIALDGSGGATLLGSVTGNPFNGSQDHFTVSRDGSSVLMIPSCALQGERPCTLVAVASTGGAATTITDAASSWGASPDGALAWFYGVRDAQGNAPLMMARVGQPPTSVATGSADTSVVILADDSGIVYVTDYTADGHGTLWLYRFATAQATRLADRAEVYQPSYSADGTGIAIATQPIGGARGITLATLDGSAPRELIDSADNVAWSQGGTLVVHHDTTPAPFRFQNGFYAFSR